MKHAAAILITVSLSALPAFAQAPDTQPVPAPEPAPEADKKEAPPPHTRTGWATLLKDTAGDFVQFPQRPSTWTLLAIGAGGALATHPADDYVQTHVVGNSTADTVFSLGQWIGSAYVQVGSAVSLWAVGRYVVPSVAGESKTNTYSEIGFDLIRAQILSQSLVHGMKYTIRRNRPTGECCAFPSGHAATAFAAASVLERHFGYRGSWPALAGAAYVATSRLVDNRHFLSDVVMGAAVGTASGWTVVGTRARDHIALQPVPVPGGMMIAFTRVPG